MIKKFLHITEHRDGKLAGIASVNTSTFMNDFCNKMGDRTKKRKERSCKSVCELCYSERIEGIYPSLEAKLVSNHEILSSRILTNDEIPLIPKMFIRFSSFGEIINRTHYLNMMAIAKKNNHAKFSLLTKRYDIIMAEGEKVENIVYVASSPMINERINNEEILGFFDKVFTVYDKDNAVDVDINCGKRTCLECMQCYSKNGGKEINEELRK